MGSTAVMNIMLGWLKGVARWVLGIFDLAGSSAFSPLVWLADNWLALLIILMAIGVCMDMLVWLLRWRPYWVWFHKKRIVIEDDDFFAGEDLVDSGLYDPSLFEVSSSQRVRHRPSTNVPRRAPVLIERVDGKPGAARRAPARRRHVRDDAGMDDPIFSLNADAEQEKAPVEDDVFNVSDLPVSRDEIKFQKNRRTRD